MNLIFYIDEFDYNEIEKKRRISDDIMFYTEKEMRAGDENQQQMFRVDFKIVKSRKYRRK